MHIEEFKNQLKTQLVNIEEELVDLGVQNPMTDKDWIPTPGEPADTEADANDLGDRSEEWQERRGTLDVLETRRNNIKRALTKIDNGVFGACEICNAPIEEDRLEANPSARTCKTHINDEAELPS